MKNGELNTTLINSYFELLRRLSLQSKEQLILKLTNSIRKQKTEATDTFFTTFGALHSDQSADEIIKDLRNSRNFNRNTAEI